MNDVSDNEKPKNGFTTGSAATAASAAALYMLINGKEINVVSISTPAGIEYTPKIYDQNIGDTFASCSIIKESGDDPDITNGIKIYSKVNFTDEGDIRIVGGVGVGKVTRPGLDQPVGEWAINSTPRKMIKETLSDILDFYGIKKGVHVEISVPEGVDIAEKTFNPHMGIEGGISIIGTSGIVEPMSTRALLETIKLDINMQYSEGKDTCVIVPGNYGVTFLENNFGVNKEDIVLCSNYVGDSIEMAVATGFTKIFFCSHIGKLIKVSGGMMNTHSMYGDRRMELMCEAYDEACGLSNTTPDENIRSEILDSVTTTAALDVLDSIGMVKQVSDVIINKAIVHLMKAANNKANIECILYDNKYGELSRNF